MTADELQSEPFVSVDLALGDWRQGDCSASSDWFAYRFDLSRPLTEESVELSGEGNELAESEVVGFAVVSQTCDVVRSSRSRPYVEVAPLVTVEDGVLREIRRGRRPQYAYISGVADRRLVADLDRIMTIEKAIVAGWTRAPGCGNDDEVRQLRDAIARKRLRFAFPDDFVGLSKKLQSRMQSKHSKNSDEGVALRELREIRVHATPAWDASEVDVFLWFIRDPNGGECEPREWAKLLEKWLELMPTQGRFINVSGVVVDLEQMTAREFVESDPLDLDHLSD